MGLGDVYGHLLNKTVKAVIRGEGERIEIYKGRLIFIGEAFVTVLDFKTNIEFTFPLERIIRIEQSGEGGSNP